MNETDFYSLIEEILEYDSVNLSLSTNLAEIEWDSLSNLTLISLLDSRFGKQIGAQQLQSSTTLNDLFTLINS